MPKKTSKSVPSTRASRPQPNGEPLAIDTVDQLKALANPMRMKLLDQFANGPKTTKQIAVALGLQPTRLYHHVAKLENAGLIKLVKTRQVRGTTEKYYSPVAASLKIDRHAFESKSAKLVEDILGKSIVDNLLGIVHEEVSEYLAQRDLHDHGQLAPDTIPKEVMFAGTELEVAESSVPIFRKKLTQLIEEFGEIAESDTGDSDSRHKYRLIVGWYPRVSK